MAYSMNPLDWGKGTVRGTGRALQGFNANLNPFNPAVTQRTGNYFGDLISRNKTANRLVMGAMPVLDPLARGTYNLSGVANYQNAAREAEKGNLRGALGQTLLGGVTTLGTAAGLAGGAGALRGGVQGVRTGVNPASSALASLRGTRLVPKGAFASPSALRTGIQQPVKTSLQNAGKFRTYLGTPGGALAAGVATVGAFGAGESSAGASPVAGRGPSTTYMPADRLERGPRGVSYKDAAGNTMTWNPRSGIYELTSRAGAAGSRTGAGAGKGGKGGKGKGGKGKGGTTAQAVAAGGTGEPAETATPTEAQLEALSPEEYEDLLSAAREAERGYQESINRVGRDTSTEERNLYDYVRGVGREVSGERQDISSALAQLGMDTSPASGAYADYLAASGQGRVAARRGQSASLLQGLAEERRQAEVLRTQRLADLERQRVNRQARASVGRAANFSQ